MLGFGTVVLLALVLLNGYVWWRLVRSTTRPGRTRRLLTLALVLLALLPMAAVVLRRQDSALSTVVQWVGFSWLGVVFYLFLTLLALEPVRWVAGRLLPGAADPATGTGVEELVASGGRRPPSGGAGSARCSRCGLLAAVSSGG